MNPNSATWLLDLLRQTGPLAFAVLAGLILMSAATWAAIWDRRRALRKAERGHERLLLLIRDRRDLDRVREACATDPDNPSARVLLAGAREAEALRDLGPAETPGETEARLRILERASMEARREEILLLQKRLTLLATVGASSPFIGLFGTVWGIMRSFQGIGQMGSATLAVVAPGIAEALVNTAAGLLAAIPAVMAYNHFQSRVRRMSVRLEGLTDEILNLWEREGLALRRRAAQARGESRG